jgi:hypothetical protein
MGLMGYRTPNIDRIARPKARSSPTAYGQQSCTAGRAVVHPRPGAVPHRPADDRHAGRARMASRTLDADHRRRDEDAGLCDRPVRQEPSRRSRRAPADQSRLRRVLRQSLPSERRGRAGRLFLSEGSGVPEEVRAARRHQVQADGKIEDTGPLNTKRMETIDEEFLASAKDFIDRQAKADKPFFCWFNSTRMHVFTHLKPDSRGQDRQGHPCRRHGRA